MNNDLRDALAALTEPPHPSLGPAVRQALASGRSPRRVRPRWPVTAAAAAILLVAVIAGAFFGFASRTPAPARTIPSQVPQAITRTTPGAQVAWLESSAGLLAYDGTGKLVAALPATAPATPYGLWRSADGATIYSDSGSELTAYSAVDGHRVNVYAHQPGQIVGDAFSPDGRLIALLSALPQSYRLQVIDLGGRTGPAFDIPRDPTASTPGVGGGKAAWGMPVFSPDSTTVYVLTDWGGPLRLSILNAVTGKLDLQASAVCGANPSSCDGPAVAARVVMPAGSPTLVAFCHGNGEVLFIDLDTRAGMTVDSRQPNPFWFSPIFTPDGRRLYLHSAGGGSDDTMTMVDLSSRKVFGPVSTPQKTSVPGPFAALVTTAYAGGVASTVPISPDGLVVYSATADGVMALRVPDLKPLAKLAAGTNSLEVWASGDGRTLFVTTDAGKRLLVMRSDGSGMITVRPPADLFGFVASEHG